MASRANGFHQRPNRLATRLPRWLVGCVLLGVNTFAQQAATQTAKPTIEGAVEPADRAVASTAGIATHERPSTL